ncbi:MAG: hypothetical protein AB7S75_08060 [Desulfococcaceae bacterium]
MKNSGKICRLSIVCTFIPFLFAACAGPALKKQEGLHSLSDYALRTQTRVRQRLAESPESMAEESLAALNEVLNYADEVRTDPDRFNLSKIQEYREKINIINENMDRFRDMTLQTDISFSVGAYRLSEFSGAGRSQCAELARKIIETAAALKTRYPKHAIRITLKTLGYTDELPIVPGSLEKTIRTNLQEPEAPAGDARRKQYNRVLSRLRAAAVSGYIMEYLHREMPAHTDIRYVEKIVGNGENFPLKNQNPPYAAQDERRRICIISPYIEVML